MAVVKFDMREFVNRLRASKEVEQIRSVNENPSIKTQIGLDIYEEILKGHPDIPIDSSALINSPDPNHALFYMSHKSSEIRYPNGHIDETGIYFNPYSIRKGEPHYYAQYVMPSGYALLNLGSIDIRNQIQEIVNRNIGKMIRGS